ncbi:GH13836 [Drosophila grimshawi]|uniref:GH13836 n=1 Tax=Drosophila grimshawi TaxID=7222 RepID=B4JR86_DROGR|nr:GH13836 [Drosophila grimshawi]
MYYIKLLLISQRPPSSDFPEHFPRFSGPGGSSNHNFYRSESYSYSSDGMGAPHIQRSVFDSRLGPGINTAVF